MEKDEKLVEDFKENLLKRMWITRGVRFTSHERLLNKNKLSAYAIGALSTYLIILSLFTAYRLEAQLPFSSVALSFTSTAVSILVLVFSQLVYANDYKTRALSYYKCAIEISKLYNKYKFISSSNLQKTNYEEETHEIVNQYESLLENYENHEPIDYNCFRARHVKELELNRFEAIYYKIRYLINGSLIYYGIIIGPPILFVLIVYIWPNNYAVHSTTK